jgi:hypothetical protein
MSRARGRAKAAWTTRFARALGPSTKSHVPGAFGGRFLSLRGRNLRRADAEQSSVIRFGASVRVAGIGYWWMSAPMRQTIRGLVNGPVGQWRR